MTRMLVALLAFAVIVGLAPAARAQSPATQAAPLLAYQSPNRQIELSIGAWFGNGRWRFTGPTDVAANNTLLMVDLRLHLRGPWTLALDYAGGAWSNITFNGAPAPGSVSGNMTLLNVDLRYQLSTGGPMTVYVFGGWQYYRARTEDSAAATSDEARAGGFRLGAEVLLPLGSAWTVRALAAYAPSLGVTEDFTSGGTVTTTQYHGSLTEALVAVRYHTGGRWAAEGGYRVMRIDFRRPTDVLEHYTDGAFLHVIFRP